MKTVKNGTFNYQILEKEYAKFIGSKHAVAVNSGTAALHLALVALGIGPGDEVIIPDFTMAACAFAVSYTGAKPVFVDCGPNSLNIDPSIIFAHITNKTKAIMAVHIYGRLCDMEKINKIAKRSKLFVIEDACEAQGAKVGNADVTCFSFFRNKIINAEEGGMITTNNKKLYEKMQDLKSMAFGPKHDYWHSTIGFNYRMPESQAKLALKSLAQAKKNIAKRKQIEAWFNELLPLNMQMPKRDAVWVYDFIPHDIEATKSRLEKNKIAHREFFKPMSWQPMYIRKAFGVPFTVNNWAKHYSERGLYIIISPRMTKREVSNIVRIICDK